MVEVSSAVIGSAVPASLNVNTPGRRAQCRRGVDSPAGLVYSSAAARRPLPLAFGVLGLSAFLLHGATYAALKSDGPLRERARKAAGAAAIAAAAAFALSFAAVGISLPASVRSVPAWAFSILVWLSLAHGFVAVRRGRDGRAFFFSAAVFLGLWGVVGAIHYPNLVRAADPALSLTVANASSSPLTLKVMLAIAVVGMPLVVAYTVFAYRVFKGKARPGEGIY